MSILMVFNGNATLPNHKFYPVNISIRESYKQYLAANAVDYYAFKPIHPVVSDVKEVNLVREVTKRNNYCLIMCDIKGDTIDLWLHSSNLSDVFHMVLTSTEAFLMDPVGKLIVCHTSGTLSEEVLNYEFVPEAPEKVLTQEDVEILSRARDEKSYARGLSMVNSIFPGQALKSKQAIKQFCARHINRFNKANKEVESIT